MSNNVYDVTVTAQAAYNAIPYYNANKAADAYIAALSNGNSVSNGAIPSEFMCPISMDLMTDPVIGTDGHTYERAALQEWLLTNTVSPLTRSHMTLADIQPNYALRASIERWRLANEPMPQPDSLLMADSKTFTVTSTKVKDETVLTIQTAHKAPMETVLIAVLDVSGSMNDNASNNRTEEGNQFSRLDLVKHSMSTLAALLNAEYKTTPSSLSIVAFDTKAQLVMPNTKMDAVGLTVANNAIKTLSGGGSTNIWDGLRMGLLQAQAAIDRNPNVNIQILLLTDGEPSRDLLPPLGIQNTLKRKLSSLSGCVTISTFGFGYNLDADLLESICVEGNGTYGFIPDCSMVGTVFINWLTKALLTVSHHITIEITDNVKYAVGDIILGRSQTVNVGAFDPKSVKIIYDNGQELIAPVAPIAQINESIESNLNAHYLSRLLEEMNDIKKLQCYDSVKTDRIIALKIEIDNYATPTEFMKDISCDIESTEDGEGQIMKACSSNKWWNTWGRNHCIAYYRALKLQQCINFKDKVLQHFASDEFKALQEKGIDIFSSLPAPTPSFKSYGGNYYGSRYAPNPAVPISLFTNPADPNIRSFSINMSNYVNTAGGCFTGDCMVTMGDAAQKRVDELKKGDVVWPGYKVEAILYTPVKKEVDMVTFHRGLKITPWHPMKLSEESPWYFPANIGTTKKMYVDAYYNLVLNTYHIVMLNHLPVATLGHGFTDNDVIKHPYFGTQAVIDDLKKHPDWESGFLVMNPENIVRSEETGLVTKI